VIAYTPTEVADVLVDITRYRDKAERGRDHAEAMLRVARRISRGARLDDLLEQARADSANARHGADCAEMLVLDLALAGEADVIGEARSKAAEASDYARAARSALDAIEAMARITRGAAS
jgi:hypothetical protein